MKSFLEVWGQTIVRKSASCGEFFMIEPFTLPTEKQMREIDPHSIDKRYPSIFDTAEVIFPSIDGGRLNLKPKEYFYFKQRFTKRFTPTWGTYYDRFTKWEGKENLILKAVIALNSWAKNTHCVFTFHTTNWSLNKYQPQGNPCLQMIELVKIENKLHLCYTYRAQDFFGRFGGNTIGLMRLLTFVCYHTGLNPGYLKGMVGYGFSSGKQKDVKILFERIKKLHGQL